MLVFSYVFAIFENGEWWRFFFELLLPVFFDVLKIVSKVALLLEILSSGDDLRFAEICGLTGDHRSNVSHLLSGLCACGLVKRVRYGVYRRGDRFTKLLGGRNPRGIVTEIANRCATNILLWMNSKGVVAVRYREDRLVLVHKCVGTEGLTVGFGRGYSSDWYGNACGRILLAFALNDELLRIINRHGLPSPRIWKEATTLPKLRRELAQIRHARRVIMQQNPITRELGVCAQDASGREAFAISTAYPVSSDTFGDQKRFELLESAAQTLNHEMCMQDIIVSEIDFFRKEN